FNISPSISCSKIVLLFFFFFPDCSEPRSNALSSTPHLRALLLFCHIVVVVVVIIVIVVVWFGLEIFYLLLQLCVSLRILVDFRNVF
ncbi:unnamed protein product, partial [Prunus brigantina]